MIHLKQYNNLDSILFDIKDILLDINDIGFWTSVELKNNVIFIAISRLRSTKGFIRSEEEYKSIKDIFNRIKDYARLNNLKLDNSYYRMSMAELNKNMDDNRFTIYISLYPKKGIRKFNEDIEARIDSNGIIKPNIKVKTDNIGTLYDKRWEVELPEFVTINYHNKLYKFKRDNIMIHSDMVQITYASTPLNSNQQGEIWGAPDTLEFDIHFAKENNKIKLDVDITYGDLMACEFSIEPPNKVKVIEYTSYHSKFDTSNTVFGLVDDSLEKIINFLNKFSGVRLEREDFNFLDQYDNYNPN